MSAWTAAHWVMACSSTRILAALSLLIAVALTSCGNSTVDAHSASTTTQLAAHNAADVEFVRNMIPHHQQAVVLGAMVPARTANPEVRMMATHISADQQAEIWTMNGLLASWGEPVEPPDMSHHGGMEMSGMPMKGMVDQATLDKLRTLDDEAFDTLWVTSMIGHHQGAVTMAQDEIAHGESRDAVHVATMIVTAQQREIAMMNHLISASQ